MSVVSMFDKKKELEQKAAEPKADVLPIKKKTEEEANFEAVMAKNAATKTRMENERKKANTGVLKSYRIKN